MRSPKRLSFIAIFTRALFVSLFICSSARAEVTPASIFGSGMVLQRERPVPVWGTAAPNESVTVTFTGQKLTTKADEKGKWKVSLEPLKANPAPEDLTIAGKDNTLVFNDVLVGEVWLCSGQSNMGLEVRKVTNAEEEIAAATYPLIRCFTAVPAPGKEGSYVIAPTQTEQRYALTPQDKCLGKWEECTPQDARNFSAVAYFFARELHKRLKVPVGIVVSSTGATAIEAWISIEGLKAVPAYRLRAENFDELAKAFLKDKASLPAAIEAQQVKFAAQQTKWFADLDAQDPGLKAKWMDPAFDVSQWGWVKLPVSVDDNPLGAPVASIWFRKDVTIPQEWVGKDLEIHLGMIDGVDETFVNATHVGKTWFDTEKYWEAKRVYAVPAAAVTSTQVCVTMRLLKTVYHLAPLGPATEMKLVLKPAADAPPADAPGTSLAGEWRMQKATDLDAGQQPPSMKNVMLGKEPGNHYGHPGAQYNGLIHPLVPFAIRGAIWYQGEANAPFYIDYRSLLPGLINSWRKEWGQGDFPFGIVQLADYFGQQTQPVERGGYVNLRESQAMALSLPNTFMATAVGVGEGADIHPKHKQEVGLYLALGALAKAYGQKDMVWAGPMYKSMEVVSDKIRLKFDFGKGMYSKGDPLVGFAIAGEDRAFYFAKAKIEGETIVVWSDKVPKPVAVRYAWATNPVCNLYNSGHLPAFPFHTDSWDLSQLVIPKDTITIPSGWVPK